MSQSRAMSLAESITNVVAGIAIALVTQIVLFQAMGLEVTLVENIGMTILFSSLSLVRGYIVRRIFNALRPRLQQELSA